MRKLITNVSQIENLDIDEELRKDIEHFAKYQDMGGNVFYNKLPSALIFYVDNDKKIMAEAIDIKLNGIKSKIECRVINIKLEGVKDRLEGDDNNFVFVYADKNKENLVDSVLYYLKVPAYIED